MIISKKQSDLLFHTLENGDVIFSNCYIVPNEETKRKLKAILNTYFASASILIIPISLELISFKYIIIYLVITTIIYYYKTRQITKTLKKTLIPIKPTFKERLIKQSSIDSSIRLWILLIFSIVFSIFSIEILLNEDRNFF